MAATDTGTTRVAEAYEAYARARAAQAEAAKALDAACQLHSPNAAELTERLAAAEMALRDLARNREDATVAERDTLQAATTAAGLARQMLEQVALAERTASRDTAKTWRIGDALVKTAVRPRWVVTDLVALTAHITDKWPVMLERLLPRVIDTNVLQAFGAVQSVGLEGGTVVPGLVMKRHGAVSISYAKETSDGA